MRVEFPSKLLSETINLTVDFISRLASGELITSASVVASLYSGTDPNPSLLINGAASISGSQVIQSITGGVLGNIYELAYTVVTTLGQTLTITDERMTRFLLTLDDAIDLVLYAAANTQGGEIFVRKAPAARMVDLAAVLAAVPP